MLRLLQSVTENHKRDMVKNILQYNRHSIFHLQPSIDMKLHGEQ